MSWCPKCKIEYREGITKCADCGCDLVESEENPEAEEMADDIRLSETEKSADHEEPKSDSIYRDSAEKAEDNRSSAWTLLLVGGVGLVAMILGMTGLLPIYLTGTNKYMVYGIMSALFLLFIVMGVISMKNSKIFAKKAESENTLHETLVKWCRDSLNPQTIDAELHLTEDMSEEILYFKRFEKLKEMLNHQFVNLDQAFLDHFIDEEYDSVFHKMETEE